MGKYRSEDEELTKSKVQSNDISKETYMEVVRTGKKEVIRVDRLKVV